MPGRKRSPERKSRSGPNIPEEQRHTVRVRVPREPAEELARRWGVSESDAVVRAVTEAAAHAAAGGSSSGS